MLLHRFERKVFHSSIEFLADKIEKNQNTTFNDEFARAVLTYYKKRTKEDPTFFEVERRAAEKYVEEQYSS